MAMIDLRSDTVTRPTQAMRDAMCRAEVGDDVFGEDPTVCALEGEIAQITAKESALFVPSGTMANQLAVAMHTRPGDDVIVGEWAHVIGYEGGAAAALSGVQFSVAGRGGLFDPSDVDGAAQPRFDWTPRTSLVAVENTHNRAGGRVWSIERTIAVTRRAREVGFAVHLDGARIWNASVALGVDVASLCGPFDTVSVCFSKGLGAPVGSALCGQRDLIREARRIRKRWGGGMRQSGILAAAALFALRQHRVRLADDHAHARAIAERLSQVDGAQVDLANVETNIVNVDVSAPATAVAHEAHALGVRVGPSAPGRIRIVTHLDVSDADTEIACEALARAIGRANGKTALS